MNAMNRDSSRQLFKNLKILPLKSQHIFSILGFLVPSIFNHSNKTSN